jgi:hypothetical protein
LNLKRRRRIVCPINPLWDLNEFGSLSRFVHFGCAEFSFHNSSVLSLSLDGRGAGRGWSYEKYLTSFVSYIWNISLDHPPPNPRPSRAWEFGSFPLNSEKLLRGATEDTPWIYLLKKGAPTWDAKSTG